MSEHASRSHATWAASATARNWNCAGAIALSAMAPSEQESIHSARGTACHEIAEKCLRTDTEPSQYLGDTVKTKEHAIEIDDELAESAWAYVDYVRQRLNAPGATLQIEQHFRLDDLKPPFDAGGTGDAVVYFPASRTLEIVDLKNGMGVVDPKDNPQLRTYALGAMLANRDLDVDHVMVTIVQPRAPHKDGRIRSDTFHVADLVEWSFDLLEVMKRAERAQKAFDGLNGNSVLFDEWCDAWLNPGKCKFCPCEGFCPALKKKALAVAAVWFDDADQPRAGNSVTDADPVAVARDLDLTELLEGWIAARWAFAKNLADSGVEIPGYQLSEKIGNRKWADDEQITAALLGAGLTDDQIFTKKLVSPAQSEKLLGAKRKALIEPFTTREVTGTNLVAVAKTSRPAAKARIEAFLEK